MATTAHGLVYPEDYADPADVPAVLAALAQSIEAALVVQDAERASLVNQFYAASPVGVCAPYPGAAAPTGWRLMDGGPHGQGPNSAIHALLGSANVPDWRDRFIVGAGGAYARGQTGGLASVTLTAAQSGVPAHTHTAAASTESAAHTHAGTTAAMSANASHGHVVSTRGASVQHTHSGTTGGQNANATHTHSAGWTEGTGTAGDDSDVLDSGGTSQGYERWKITVQQASTEHGHVFTTGNPSADHSHTVDLAQSSVEHTHAFSTGNPSVTHQHNVTVAANAAANATQAHENRPPFYAATWIIKVV